MRIKLRCFELFAEKLDFGLDSGGGGVGGGGGMLRTMLRKHTRQYHHKSRFTRTCPLLVDPFRVQGFAPAHSF